MTAGSTERGPAFERRIATSNAAAESAEEKQATKWGVLVVHVAGDTGPGVTVDTFLASLAAADSPRFRVDWSAEVRRLPDVAEPEPPARLIDTFPAHFFLAVRGPAAMTGRVRSLWKGLLAWAAAG